MAVLERPTPTRSAPRARRRPRRSWPDGWPLAAVCAGYPLWWLLGVGQLVFLLAAGVMAAKLVRTRGLRVPRGFGFWLLFLAWAAFGVLVLQVDAPGAIARSSKARYLLWLYQFSWYVGATVILLYVGNFRRTLGLARLSRILSWMFVTVVAGGLLGVLLPHLQFPSLLEAVLPQGLSSYGFVHAQIHPSLAEIQDVLGGEQHRPSAPFPYANAWGLNYACYLPFFVSSWLVRGAGWRRVAGPVVLAVSLVPVIASLNRGLWLALAACAVVVILRSVQAGHLRMFVTVMLGCVALCGVLLFSPLGQTIETRLSTPTQSVDTRSNLGKLSIDSMRSGSPVVGFGTTRDVQGSFRSIAGGATELCPHCTPPPLGTQGRLWFVAFTEGFVGLVFFLAFFSVMIGRSIRSRSPYVTVGLTVLTASFVTFPLYDWNGPGLVAMAIGAAYLWRGSADLHATRDRPLRSIGSFLRRQAWVLIVCMVVGAAGGAVLGHHQQAGARATASYHLTDDSTVLESVAHPTTLDTLGKLAESTKVKTAITRADPGGDPADLDVTATPNTRVLHLTYQAADATTARRVAEAAGTALLEIRGDQLTRRAASDLHALEVRQRALRTALGTVGVTTGNLDEVGIRPSNPASTNVLVRRRARLAAEYAATDASIARLRSTSPAAGRRASVTDVHSIHGRTLIWSTSGLALGLLAGISAGALRERVPSRRRRRHEPNSTEPPTWQGKRTYARSGA